MTFGSVPGVPGVNGANGEKRMSDVEHAAMIVWDRPGNAVSLVAILTSAEIRQGVDLVPCTTCLSEGSEEDRVGAIVIFRRPGSNSVGVD